MNQRYGLPLLHARLVGDFTEELQGFRCVKKVFDMGVLRKLHAGSAVRRRGKK
jgi:hypothetical protein